MSSQRASSPGSEYVQVEPNSVTVQPRTSRNKLSRWENLRPTIAHLYSRCNLQDLMTEMEQNHGFCAPKWQYMSQLHQWGLLRFTANPNAEKDLPDKEHMVARNECNAAQDNLNFGGVVSSNPCGNRSCNVQWGTDSEYDRCDTQTSQDSGPDSHDSGPDSQDSGFYSIGDKEQSDLAALIRKNASSYISPTTDARWMDNELRSVGFDDVQYLLTLGNADMPSRHLLVKGNLENVSRSLYGDEESWSNGLSATGPTANRDGTTSKMNDHPADLIVCSDLPANPSDNARSSINNSSRADIQSVNVNGTLPLYTVGHTCTIDPTSPSKLSLVSFKTTDTGNLTFTGDESELCSELNEDSSSAQSSSSSCVDLSDDVCRAALDRFLNWVDEFHMSQLLFRFNSRSHLLPSESSCRSHTNNDSSQGQLTTPSDSTASSSQGTSNAKKKRRTTSSDEIDEQGVQNDEQALDSPAPKKPRKMKLACHFYKRNPGRFSEGRYKTCPHGFDGLNRLKDHQNVAHKPAYFCKRCKRIFKTQDLKSAHEDEDVRCERRDDPTFMDYLTTDKQRAALARKKPVGIKDEDFWFEMWDGYFPMEERPNSAFQDLDPTLVAFQSFAEQEADSIVQAYSTYYPDHGHTIQELTEFWRFGIHHVVANFASLQGSSVSTQVTAPVATALSSQEQSQQIDIDHSALTLSFIDAYGTNWLDPKMFSEIQQYPAFK